MKNLTQVNEYGRRTIKTNTIRKKSVKGIYKRYHKAPIRCAFCDHLGTPLDKCFDARIYFVYIDGTRTNCRMGICPKCAKKARKEAKSWKPKMTKSLFV